MVFFTVYTLNYLYIVHECIINFSVKYEINEFYLLLYETLTLVIKKAIAFQNYFRIIYIVIYGY